MSQTIEIESIARLDVKPGETLVVTLPERCNLQELDVVKQTLSGVLPDGVRYLVMRGDVRLDVVADTEGVPA